MGIQEAIELWDEARGILSKREETSNPTAEAYLSYLMPQSFDSGTLVFSSRLSIAKQWVENRYLPYINDVLYQLTGSLVDVAIVVQEETAPPVEPLITQVAAPSSSASPPPAEEHPPSAQAAQAAPRTPSAAAHQHPSYSKDAVPAPSGEAPAPGHTQAQDAPFPPSQGFKTFESFIVGDSNGFAFSAAQGVAEMPGLRFNPLFIYGRSGLGKTHLLLAIKDFIDRYNPERQVVYAPTSEFVNDFTSAMASVNKDLTDFRQKYYSCDVLLLDDVQYLEGKESTTNALFDIFNIFIDRKKQIVLSADRGPNELAMDERYTSRFSQGLTAGIQPPSFEMKMAIFNNYEKYYCSQAGIAGVRVPNHIAQHIIELSGSNIRELEGAISSICFAISRRSNGLQSVDISVEEAEQIVGKVFLHNEKRQIEIKTIQQEVEQYFKISHADMIGPHRSKNITYPRQIAMYLSRRLTTKSYPEIGKLFGNKDHTTVLYAIKNVEGKYMKDIEKKIEIERLAERITQ